MTNKIIDVLQTLVFIGYCCMVLFNDALSAELNFRHSHLRQPLHRTLTSEQVVRIVTNAPKDAAIQLPKAYAPPWAKDTTYQLADRVTYANNPYLCLQAHTVHDAAWTPAAVPALWRLIKQPTIAGQLPDWVQPLGAHDTYKRGDKVRYNGKDWESTVNNNVWIPGIYGWKEIL